MLKRLRDLVIPPWVKLAALALAFGGTFYFGWHERGIRCENARLKEKERAQEQFDKQLAEANERAADYERNRARGQAESRQRETTIRETYREIEVPGECAAPDSVRGVLGDAVRSANGAASGEPVAAVPPAS